MTIPINGGGGGLPQLAPDLTYPSSRLTASSTWQRIAAINASAGLTTALSLTGKYAVTYLLFRSLSSESVTVKLTIDGVVIWNDTFTTATTMALFGNNSSTGAGSEEVLQCNSSLLLEIQTATDTSIDLDYLARPII